MNVDPTGTFFLLTALAVIGISALLGAIDGGITAAMNGQNFWLGFAAGAIGGAVAGVISLIPMPNILKTLLGRLLSSAIYNVANELFQTGSLKNMNWNIFIFDLGMDVLFSGLYMDAATNFGTKIASRIGGKFIKTLEQAASSLYSGIGDAIVDIFQTGVMYNSKVYEELTGRPAPYSL